MVDAGRNRFRVTVQRRVEFQNPHGEVEIGYVDVSEEWASIEALSGREFFAAQQIQAEISTRIRMRYIRGLDSTYRVVHQVEHDSPPIFDYYDVVTVLPDSRSARREVVLMCVKRASLGWRTQGTSDGSSPGPFPASPGFSVDWSQINNIPTTFPPEAHTHAAGDVVSGTFADARIAESNVTQHEAALSIDWSQLVNVPPLASDWDDITGKPTEFPPSAHVHDAGDVTTGTFNDARIAESNVTQHEAALSIDWTQLTSVPSTFTPAAHVHDAGDVTTGAFNDARIAESNVTQHEAALSIDWMQLTGVPLTFPPTAHVHAASDITGGTFNDARIAASNVTQHQAALSIGWSQLTGVPSSFTPSAHVHAASDITSGTFNDARIASSNVTQHQAALTIGWSQLTGIPTFDHGALAGLADDDHTQYIRVDGTRAFTGTQTTRALAVDSNDSRDIGALATRYRTLYSTGVVSVKGSGTITVANNGSVVGYLGATSTGTASIVANPGVATSLALSVGAAYTTSSGNATITATGRGSTSIGEASTSGSGAATITASGTGSSASGSVSTDTSAAAELIANSTGSFAQGSVVAAFGAAARIRASGLGSFAQGSVSSNGSLSFIDAASLGSFAQGSALLGSINVTGGGAFGQGSAVFGNITVSANGAFGQGFAQSADIVSSGSGSLAHGFALSGNAITASGPGSLAIGYSLNGAISATTDNAFQFGVGTNSQTDSLQVGNTIHIKGTVGAFGSAANGQIWRGGTSNNYVLVRSNGANVQLGPVNTWITGAHATLRDFTGTTTAAQALQLIETLVEDLRAANII